MPYIHFSTNFSVGKSVEEKFVAELGQIIELIPGKTEKWLMVKFEDRAKLYFGGDDEKPVGMVVVKAFGNEQSEECYDALTRAISAAAEKILCISPARLYVEYETVKHWGWNGANFKIRR